MNFGKGIRTLLQNKKLSQKDLSKLSNISETSISLIVKGRVRPQKETLNSIAKALNVKSEVISLLSIDKKDVPEERKEYYDLIWDSIQSNILALFLIPKNK